MLKIIDGIYISSIYLMLILWIYWISIKQGCTILKVVIDINAWNRWFGCSVSLIQIVVDDQDFW